jgi:outer membrane protein assembly factor BamB
MKRHVLTALIVSLALTGCSKAPKEKLKGKRIDILFNQVIVEVNPLLANVDVEIPPEINMPFWPQTYGNAAHYPQHVKLPKKVTETWTKSIGKGSGDNRSLLNPPIVGENAIFTLNTEGELVARSTHKGKVLWEAELEVEEEEQLSFSGGLALGEHLYVTAGSGDVMAYNPQTGEKVWQISVGSPIRSAPTLAEGKLFILTYDNHTYALSTEDGSLLWTHSSIEESLAILGGAAPAVADGIVIVPYSSGEIYALRTTDGRYLWHDSLSLNVGGDPFSSLVDIEASPVIADSIVYAVNHNGQLTAFHLGTGRRLWNTAISATQTPWVAGNMIYIVTDNNTLVALHRQRGQVKWIADLVNILEKASNKEIDKNTIWAGPILAGNRLIVNTSTGYALSFAPDTGKPLSAVALDDGSELPPVSASGSLYFLTTDGEISAYR